MNVWRNGFLLLLVASVSPVLGYYSYQQNIPNGNNVNHPCKANYQWRGVGHQNPLGGGPRNVFGRDFKDIGNSMWTETLCQMDSDGDGFTNGQELGDPNCVWAAGQIPERVFDITHPGICNPYAVGICENRDTWVECDVHTLSSCAAINKPEVIPLEFRFKEVTVPNTETNYYCQTFELPQIEDYHIVAYEPLIDNEEVLHHMILYGCNSESVEVIDTPELCGMSATEGSCYSIITLWAVGFPGLCYEDNVGFRFGNTSYKRFKLEVHYNNAKLVSGYKDASGMKVYYQPIKPEVQDLVTFTVGQRLLEIPPTMGEVTETATCPADCTRMLFTKPAYIISSINHMHYLGKSQSSELYRDGKMIADLSTDEIYSYDSPQVHAHDPPVEIRPGDEIRTTCVFNSLSTDRWTYYGDSTSSEMCFVFITLYPADAVPYGEWCVSQGVMSACDMFTGKEINGCNWKDFTNMSHPATAKLNTELERNCNLDGFCRPECQKTVEMMNEDACLKHKDTARVVNDILNRKHEGTKFLSRYYSCKPEPNCNQECPNVCEKVGYSSEDYLSSGIVGHSLSRVTFCFLLVVSMVIKHHF